MAGKGKYYVVWHGINPGIYSDWNTCKTQISGVQDAKYKAFSSKEEAENAYKKGWKANLSGAKTAKPTKMSSRPSGDFIAVDAACSGNPGAMEYRGVWCDAVQELFHQGPFQEGTNNIGEFLAIVHALALQTTKNTRFPIYSDSANAITWIRKKKCNTKLTPNAKNAPVFDLIDRAEHWLANNKWDIPVFKWETASWGEIPADFGRK